MLKNINEIFKIWNFINKELSIKNACKKFKGRCLIISLLFIFVIFYFNELNIGVFIIIMYLIGMIFVNLMNKFRKKIITDNQLDSIDNFKDYWLDIKYFLLKNEISKNNNLKRNLNIIIKEIEEYHSIKNMSIVEKNPVFSISFAILLAVLSSGILDKGNDLVIMVFFFAISIIGIIVATEVHPIISFNKEILWSIKL